MTAPLMPKATAVWLVENTTLTFDQIAAYCELHPIEVQAIADGDVAANIIGLDPIEGGQLTQEELDRCMKDPSARLVPLVSDNQVQRKQGRYTPMARRQDKPDAILWVLKHYPHATDAQIMRLIGTTKKTIASVREKSHWNAPNLRARHPVLLGICTQKDLDKVLGEAVHPITDDE